MDSATLDASHIKSLVAALGSTLQDPNTLDEAGRVTALEAAKSLTDALEFPQNAIPLMLLMPNTLACMKIAVDLNLFADLAKIPNQPHTASALATNSGAEAALIVRIMRVLTASGFAKEVGEATYTSTPKTVAMTSTYSSTGTKHCFDRLQSAVKLPDFFQKHGYKNPTTDSQTPFQFAANTTSKFYEWVGQHPAIADNLHTFMVSRLQSGVVKSWTSWFPVAKQVLEGTKADPTAVTMVDIGGGRGPNLTPVLAKHPHAPGRFIFQDLDNAADPTATQGRTEFMVHDFFTPQPIKGARLYFIGSVLADWDDASSLQILKNTASAMEKGYSKLYISEWILPDVGCPLREAGMDIQMMCNFGGMFRTRGHWGRLLREAGFRDVEFWMCPDEGSVDGIVEASL
ncbi:S-adenosyl-L-methionine-dependent methyltransferase [Usnea florida]